MNGGRGAGESALGCWELRPLTRGIILQGILMGTTTATMTRALTLTFIIVTTTTTVATTIRSCITR
jgi:hypothetical protein